MLRAWVARLLAEARIGLGQSRRVIGSHLTQPRYVPERSQTVPPESVTAQIQARLPHLSLNRDNT